MKSGLYKTQIIMFITMVIVGMLFNGMNVLAYRFSDLYISLTLFYSGLLMASNMMWAHEIVHYLSMGHFNIIIFFIGIFLSIFVSMLLREQLFVDEYAYFSSTSNSWLKHIKTFCDRIEKDLKLDTNSFVFPRPCVNKLNN